MVMALLCIQCLKEKAVTHAHTGGNCNVILQLGLLYMRTRECVRWPHRRKKDVGNYV